MGINYAYFTVTFADGTVDPLHFKEYNDYVAPNGDVAANIVPQPVASVTKSQAHERFTTAMKALTEVGSVVFTDIGLGTAGDASTVPNGVEVVVGFHNADTIYEYVVKALDSAFFTDTDDKSGTVTEGIAAVLDIAMNGFDNVTPAVPGTLPATPQDAIFGTRYEVILDDTSTRSAPRLQYGTTDVVIPSLTTGENVTVATTDIPLSFNP